MVEASRAPRAAAALSALGYRHMTGASPAGLYGDPTDRHVDLSVLEPDDAGAGFIQQTSNGVARLELDELQGHGSIGPLPVRCLTAAAQVRVHMGYERRPEDNHDLRLLREGLESEPQANQPDR